MFGRNNFTFSLTLKAVNLLTAPLRGVLRSIQEVDRAAASARGLQQFAQRLDAIGGRMQRWGGAASAGGVALGAALGLAQLPQQAIDAQHQLRSIGNAADLSGYQISTSNTRLLQLARETNQYQTDLIAGLGTLTASGLAFRDSMAAMPAIGRTATAMTADVNELSQASYAMIQNLGVLPRDLGSALNVAADAGQRGAFELRDMAAHFSSLTATAQQLGMKGVPAVAQLSAALEIARRGAGTNDEAANNARNFLMKLTSPETVKNFKEFGVDLEAEWRRIARAGEDPILGMLNLIQRVTRGDQFKLGELFGDMQVLSFIKPMQQNLRDYVAIRDASLQAGSTDFGPVDRNFSNMMGTTKEQAKQLRINLATLSMPNLEDPLRRVNQVLMQINANPVLQRAVLGTIAALVGGGAASMAAGTLVRAFAPAITGFGKLRLGAALVRSGFAGAAPAGGLLARSLMSVGSYAASIPARIRVANRSLRDMLGLTRLANAVQFHGGFWRMLHAQLLRARAAILWNTASLRAWAMATRTAARGAILDLPGRLGSAAAATRTWTTAKLASTRASTASLFSLRAWSAAIAGIPARLTSALTALRAFTVGQLASRAASLGSAVATKIAAAATWLFNAALYANPLGIVVALLVVAALLIFKYWKPIAGFFRGLWAGLREGIAPVLPLLAKLGRPLRPVIELVKTGIHYVGSFFRWLGRLLKPVDDVGGKAENLGLRVGRGLGRMLAGLVNLPGRLWKLGGELAVKLWDGIKTVLPKIGPWLLQALVGAAKLALKVQTFMLVLGVRLLVWLWNGLRQLLPKIGPWLLGAATGAFMLLARLQGAIYGVSVRLGLALWRGLRQLLPKIGPWLLQVLIGVVGLVLKLPPALIGLGLRLGVALWVGLRRVVPRLGPWLLQALVGLVGLVLRVPVLMAGLGVRLAVGLWTGLRGVVGLVLKLPPALIGLGLRLGGALWTGLRRVVPRLGPWLLQALVGLVGLVLRVPVLMVGLGVRLAVALWTGLRRVLPMLGPWLLQAAIGAFMLLARLQSALYGLGARLVAAVWRGLRQVLPKVGPWLLQALGGMLSLWSRLEGWMVGLGIRAITGLWTGLRGLAVRLGSLLGGAVRGLWRFMATLPGRFRDAGVKMLTQLWEGMKSLAHKPAELMRSIVQRVRNFLPFSPAKEGPLRDLHRVRIVETFSAAIRPNAAVAAMRTAAAAVFAMSPLLVPVRAAAAPAQLPPSTGRATAAVPPPLGLPPAATVPALSPAATSGEQRDSVVSRFRSAAATPAGAAFLAAGGGAAAPAAAAGAMHITYAPTYQVQGGSSSTDDLMAKLEEASRTDQARFRDLIERFARRVLEKQTRNSLRDA